MRVSDLILVNHEGEVVKGSWPVNRAAFAIHSAIHRARPDVIAAAHCHSVHGKAFSSLGKRLDPLTQDACAFYEDHAVFDDYTGVVLRTSARGRAHRPRPGSHKAAILRNHGLLTAAGSVGAAAWFFIALDRSCQAQLLAEAAGTPICIDHPNAKLTHSQVGSEIAGWFSFQPMYEWIVRQEPHLLD
jgi:ribulose-5-phosphate 4-epimerase/fuculose-1-phosphate aldolase